MSRPTFERVLAELKKYGIHNEKDLNKALKDLKPINIGCMVSPIKKGGFENGVKA